MNYDYHHRDFHLSQSNWMFAFSLFQSPPYFSDLLASLMTHCAVVFQLARMYTNLSRNFTSILVCLYVVHFNLFTKGRQTLAEEKNETQPSTPAFPECPSPIDLTVDTSWLETVVFGNFRIWHIMFSGMAIFTGITVVMCCLFRCRIPRTKQEIEADFLRKKITESFLSHLEKIKIDELQGPFDQGNLLPLFKKVELFEEDRVQKNEGFEKRKLTWRQKLKRILTGKDSIDELERSFDESKDQSGAENKMTQEEMETVEKEVEGAKTDTSAINLINDQLVIFGFIGESKKDRKKRLKEQKKTEKAALKEQKAHEKLEKKLAKLQPRKSIAAGSLSARSKSAKTLLELRPDSLENDHKKEWHADMKVSFENGGDSIAIDIEDRSEGTDATPKGQPEEMSTYEEKKHTGQEDRGYEEISLAIPEKEEVMTTKKSFASKFSFRDTVKQLINFGSKPKQKEELVINIELVKKEDELPLPIPQIECSPPEYEDEQELILEKETHHKKRKAKMIKKDSVMKKDESLDRNLLQIPEMTKCTKEMNTERKKKEGKVKEEKIKRENEKGKIVNVQDEAVIVRATKSGKEHKKKSTHKDGKREQEKGHKEITDKAANAMEQPSEQPSESSKRVQLKRQTEKAKQEGKSEIEQKTEKKSKDRSEQKADLGKPEKLCKDAKLITIESETKYREKGEVGKLKETTALLDQTVKPKKDDKSKVKHKEEKTVAFEPVKEKPLKVDSKKEKSKMKRLEFDDRSTERTKSVKKESAEKGKIDRKVESFPMVVEEIKLQQRMATRESEKANGHHSLLSETISSMPHPAKEHSTRVSKSTKRFSTSAHEQRSSPKTLKRDPASSVTVATDDAQERRTNFNQMVTNLNEELKEAVDCRRKKQMKRSKTIVEDVITPQEDEKLRSRSRDEFKKRLSEVLLRRRQMNPEDSQMKGEQVASVLQVRQASKQTPDGSSLEIIAAKSRQIRILTKQATSSSAEIEIPVEHVYTRGLSASVQVHPTTVDPECERDLVRHPLSMAAVSISSVPPSPTPSRASSTISVVTDNLVKKLVKSSPETGENRELTYERSRDIIFSVDQSAQQYTSSAGPQIGINRSMEKNPPIEPSEQSSGRHKTKDKHKEKHIGRHK